MKFSDPLIEHQVVEFTRYVDTCKAQSFDAKKLLETAAYLNEWSRNLFDKTFGRTTVWECDQITALFRDTAELLLKQEGNVDDYDFLRRIHGYTERIQRRSQQMSA